MHETYTNAPTQQEHPFELLSSNSNSPIHNPATNLDPKITHLCKMQCDILQHRQAINWLLASLASCMTTDIKVTANPLVTSLLITIAKPLLTPMTPATTQPSPTAQVSTAQPLASTATSTLLLMVILSQIARFLQNTCTQNLTLWIPDAL